MLGSPINEENQLIVPEWTFGMVVEQQTIFDVGEIDALIGLAYP